MADKPPLARTPTKPRVRTATIKVAGTLKSAARVRPGSPAALAVEDARQAGLLDGDRSEHVSFRAPKALVEAAMRQAGVTSTTELGVSALAMIAQPDPTAEFMKRPRGRLGSDHKLDY